MSRIMDELDENIIAQLKKNARLPVIDLAEKLGVPRTTAVERIRRLENNGIIRGYGVRLDHARTGKPMTAFVMIQVGREGSGTSIEISRTLGKNLSQLRGIEDVYIMAGEWDIMVKVRAGDNQDLYGVLQRMFQLKGLSRTLTLNTFETIQETA